MEPKETYEDELGFIPKQKLINEDYSYDNILGNPIIKAIAEADRTIMDLTEMAWKKHLDAKKYKDLVNAGLQDIPAYQTSAMIGKLIRLNSEVDDIIKLQNLQIKNLRRCITEVYDLVLEKYGVLTEDKKKVKNIDYNNYLQDLTTDEKLKGIVNLILSEFQKDKTTINEKKKFELACANIYSKESNEKNKIIIAKIMRMEY